MNTPSLRNQRVVKYLAGGALALGLLAPFAGSSRRQGNAQIDVAELARQVESEDDHVTAVELAGWIRDRRQNLRVVDLRDSADYDVYHIPLAERMSIRNLEAAQFRKDEIIVLYSGGGAHAAQGWVFLRALGYGHVYFLRGGLQEWLDDVMRPTIPASAPETARAEFGRVSAISRYFGGTPRLGGPASSGPSSGPSAAQATAAADERLRRRGC